VFDDFKSRRLVTEVHTSDKEWIMSLFAKLMIGGWASTFAMVGFYSLSESGKLLKIRKRMALWLETDHMPEEGLQPEIDDAA
jgi:hypothetical protein